MTRKKAVAVWTLLACTVSMVSNSNLKRINRREESLASLVDNVDEAMRMYVTEADEDNDNMNVDDSEGNYSRSEALRPEA